MGHYVGIVLSPPPLGDLHNGRRGRAPRVPAHYWLPVCCLLPSPSTRRSQPNGASFPLDA